MTSYQFFKAFHHHSGVCNWPVVIETGGFLGRGTMIEDFRQGGTVDLERDLLKILLKTPAGWSAQSFSICPETPSGLPWVYGPQCAPHLTLLHCEGEVAMGCIWLLCFEVGEEEVQLL